MPNPNGHGALKTQTTLFFPLVTQNFLSTALHYHTLDFLH
jgi:hypothetical protein